MCVYGCVRAKLNISHTVRDIAMEQQEPNEYNPTAIRFNLSK